jgi:capsular exopolysaccharide synthesis family protein
MVERQNQALISARLHGLKTSNISIIDRAEIPLFPISPKKGKNIFLALLIGLFGGVGLCFFLDYLDNTIKGPEDVEKLAQLPSLGVIPYLPPEGLDRKKGYRSYASYHYKYGKAQEKEQTEKDGQKPQITQIELVNFHHPSFFISEDYRTVRTSILLSHAEGPPKTITFTSSLPGEGKTTTAANMAVSFGQLEQNVLVLDADLRKPRMHKIFLTRNLKGLSSYLTGKVALDEAIQKTKFGNTWLLPSGPIPPNPTELLNSKKMKEMISKLKDNFGVVIIDTPPVLAVVDPVIASALSDATVFVLQAGKTTIKPFLRAYEELKRAKSKIIGVLFNEAKLTREGYYSPSYRHHYKYHYYEHGEDTERTA